MTQVAPTMQAFFTDRLIRQRQASPHTVVAYRDAVRLLFNYVSATTGKMPAELDFEDLDAATISRFLIHLEHDRGVSVATRNAWLAAVRSLFQFASYRHPEHAATIARVLAIPAKRQARPLVTFLDRPETDALLAAPDRGRWAGRRDQTLLVFAVQTGLRASELAAVARGAVQLGRGPHVLVWGKGRKERAVPSPATLSKRCAPGLTSAVGAPTSLPFLPRPGDPSGETPSANSSSSTPRPRRPPHAHPWPPSK